jgi:Putative Flp pilus-assembly TadE/G-like
MTLKKNKEKGQVLIFAIVILIILLIATLFLFDLHSIIRSKIKLETAEQSAALAAAKWQARSLNLIGEINLIKAANGLLGDEYGIETIGITEDEEVVSANKTLTEMQSRISFCGPLIAFGAAQQAAKNNGVNIYTSDPQSGYKTVYTDLNSYLEKLNPINLHPRYNIEYPNYYRWREPYRNMLQHITDQGLAVRPNGRFAGLDNVDPPWLCNDPNDDRLYNAILNKMWCHPTLNMIIKYPDSYWNGKWYNIDFEQTSFPGESEIYTLGVSYTDTSGINETDVENALNNIVGINAWEIRPKISWCTYDNHWARKTASGHDNLSYTGPNNDGLNYWSRGMFLRDDLKKNIFYGGATAYAECYQKIKLMNKYKSNMATPYGKDHPYAGSDQMEKAQLAVQNDIIRKTSSRELKVGNDSASDGGIGGAVAKPIGVLGDDDPPTDAIIVLPLFVTSNNSPNVALVPSAMQKIRPLRINFSDLEKFVIWLSTIDDLHNPGSDTPNERYLTALQQLDSATYRKTGWNNDYVQNDSDINIYFNDAYKYSETNPTGAGWLQQIYMRTDANRDDTPGELEEQEDGWNTRIYSGNKYILKNRHGELVTNEQMICRWTPGGPGPGPGPGTRIGPPHL